MSYEVDIDNIFCPLTETHIFSTDCLEVSDCANGLMRDDSIPMEFKSKEQWRDLCRNCKYNF